MAQTYDPLTAALTGGLPALLIIAALLTWLVAVVLLASYRRAVRRSMKRGGGTAPAAQPNAAEPSRTAPAPLADESGPPPDVTRSLNEPTQVGTSAAGRLLTLLLTRRWRAGAAYAIGACVFATLVAIAALIAGGMEILPLRLLFVIWLHLWPLVLTLGIVSASTRAEKTLITAGYFAGLSTITALTIARSPEATWGQSWLAWAIINLPATVLLLAFLSRRVRAVGPLVFVFMLLAFLGGFLLLLLVGSSDDALYAAITLADAAGYGAAGTLVAIVGTGFLLFAVGGAIALRWIRSRYLAKQISDESLTIDAVWLLFALDAGVRLVFSHPAWILTTFAAFAAFKVTSGAALRAFAKPEGSPPRKLLLLRSFAIGTASERLFDALEKSWRRVGSIQMIAGPDLATRTLEPHEFLDFVSGRLSRRFIGDEETLERRLRETDTAPDADGRFRVNDFFCRDHTWRLVFGRLARDTHAVLMDLRGFSPDNQGCIFEIRELVNTLPLSQLVFVVDRRTKEPFLRAVLADAFTRMSPASPNQALAAPRAGVLHLDRLTRRGLEGLLGSLAAAATAEAAVRT